MKKWIFFIKKFVDYKIWKTLPIDTIKNQSLKTKSFEIVLFIGPCQSKIQIRALRKGGGGPQQEGGRDKEWQQGG